MYVPTVVLVAALFVKNLSECKFLKFTVVSNIHWLLKWTLHGLRFFLIVPLTYGDWNNCKLSRRPQRMTREKSVRKNHSWQPVENWAHYHDYSPPLCIPHFPNRILDGKCKSKLNKTQIIKNQLQGQTRLFFGKGWVKGVAKEEAGGWLGCNV